MEEPAKSYHRACRLHEPACALTVWEVALGVDGAKTVCSDYWSIENFFFFPILMLRPVQPASEEKLENAYSPWFNLITCKLIKDVIFISRGNETFSRHHVRSLAEGGHVSALAAFCCVQQSLGLSSRYRHLSSRYRHMTQSVISCSNLFKGMNWTRAKNDYPGSEQEVLCVLVSTNLSNSKKTRECHHPIW